MGGTKGGVRSLLLTLFTNAKNMCILLATNSVLRKRMALYFTM